MYFYFEQVFRNALNGINATAVPTTMVQIAGAILIAALLFNVYEAFVRGGDVRTLGVGAVKYLIFGLILLNYSPIFLGVNTMFNQVAEYISTVGPGGMDVFNAWRRDVVAYTQTSPSFYQKLWPLVSGGIPGLLESGLLLLGYLMYAVTYPLFCIFYAFYGAVLYVCAPLVLALYPALSTTGLARSYLTNLIIFHSWGLIYAILGCLMSAIHLGTVAEVLARGDAGGFFAGTGEALLLGLASILLALCIAFIPMIARRIVQGDVGSTMFAVMSAAVTAATLGATAAVNGLGYAISHGRGGGEGGNPPPGGGGGGKGSGGGKDNMSAAGRSSQQAPKPPEDKGPDGTKGSDGTTTGAAAIGSKVPEGPKTAETASANADAATVAAKETNNSVQNGGGDGGSKSTRGNHNRPSPFHARVYTPVSLTAMATAGAGMLLGTAYRKTANAFRSRGSAGDADKG
ncbi:MAG: hypothetical protein LC130_27380 [Bryobacterales bacterium]|nr:hypothetical protein [Bryobacterales bacterium]